MENWFRHVEKILYSYPEMKVRLAYLNDCINRMEPKSTAKYGTSLGGGGDNQGEPELIAIKKVEFEKEKRELEREIRAIERVCRAFDEDEKEIFEYKYCKKLGNAQIYDMAVPMSRRTFYRKRRSLVKKAAKRLRQIGYLDCG